MKVLVLESDRNAADDVIEALETAGHEVRRCHEAGAPAFPCKGLDESACPLDTAGGVDVAVTVRAQPHPRPTETEDGVTCALRTHVPVVLASTGQASPYEGWTTAVVDNRDPGAVVAAVEAAAAAPLARHGAAATAEATDVLRAAGIDGPASVTVTRLNGSLRVELDLPAETPTRITETVGVRVAGRLRRLDPYARSIDVTVSDPTLL